MIADEKRGVWFTSGTKFYHYDKLALISGAGTIGYEKTKKSTGKYIGKQIIFTNKCQISAFGKIGKNKTQKRT